ncbi:MAG TPA: MBL fold metallo-hydrolase [Methanocella sp.]|nr:MBL fold metallo-hydrolase [Methanocella sp.]
MEIVPGIHLIDSPVGCNTYLIIDQEITLVDTGLRGNERRIFMYLHKLGYGPADVRRIIITHAHIDHINCLHQLKKETGAIVICEDTEADFITGKRPLRRPGGLFGIVFKIIGTYYYFKPVQVDLRLRDGDPVPGTFDFRSISLPGHSEGNMGLYSPEKKVLFSSDSVRVIGGKPAPPGEKFTADMTSAIRSIRKMSELYFDVLLPGHGNPITSGASEAVKHLYNEVKH